MGLHQKRTIREKHQANMREIFPIMLRAQIGAGKNYKSVSALSRDTGISDDALNRYLRGVNLPDLADGVALMDVLGPVFASSVMAQARFAGLFRVEGDARPGDTLREVLEGAGALAAAWADLRIDHTEWPTVQRELNEAMVCIAQFLASANRCMASAKGEAA